MGDSYVLCLQLLYQARHSIALCCFCIVIWQLAACFFSLIMHGVESSALGIMDDFSEWTLECVHYLGESYICFLKTGLLLS